MLYGAIIGDIVGSKYEFNNIKTKEFDFYDKDMFFTDDTVMSIAIYNSLLKCKGNYSNLHQKVIDEMRLYGRLYPNRGYGGRFALWLINPNPLPYNSFGNGSAMRVSAVPYFAKNLDEVKKLSKAVTEVTHNHPEGLKGAEATAVAIYMALNKCSKKEIKKYIEDNYYNLNFTLDELRPTYKFNEICQDTVPQAIKAFLESENFVDCIRNGISIGGDSDTICAIAGSIAEAYYGIDDNIKETALSYLDENLKNIVLKANAQEYVKKGRKQ